MEPYLYLIIFHQKKEKENSIELDFESQEDKSQQPLCIYSTKVSENGVFYHIKILKMKKSSIKISEDKKYSYEFEISENRRYRIIFKDIDKSFIYDSYLEIYDGVLRITTEKNLEYDRIFYYFLKVLENNKDENLTDTLYNETLDLYLKEGNFSLLILLFIKIYQKKDLCNKLLTNFKEANENINKTYRYYDRKSYLKEFLEKCIEIKNNAKKLIYDNNYNSRTFYAILLCYFNYYDYKNFSATFNELSKQKPELEDLYEILIIYYSHFKNPINQNYDFFDKFIKYCIENKEFSIFKIGINYIKDIKIFINILDQNKDDIYNKYIINNNSGNIGEFIIKSDENLKFEKLELKEIKIMISKINSIIDFADKNNTFMIDFTNNFWEKIFKCYQDSNADNILIFFELRKTFINYYNLFTKICKSINRFLNVEVDKYSSILDHMINEFIRENKNLKSIEKLSYITTYNPYYKEDQYSDKRNYSIFDLFKLDDVDEEFIENFRRMNFEKIFKNNIEKYISKIFCKIDNIFNFGTAIKLINIKYIENKDIFFNLLENKYNIIENTNFENLTEIKVKELAVKTIVDIAIINFIYLKKEKKFEFLNHIKKLLSKDIIYFLLNETIKVCINKDEENYEEIESEIEDEEKDVDFSKMKEYVLNEFINELENEDDVNNIINLIECLEGKTENKSNEKKECENLWLKEEKLKNREKVIDEFLNKLFEKNLFTVDDFFLDNKNNKILLLYKLNEKGRIKYNEEEYYEKIVGLLGKIKEELDGNIKKSKLETFLKNDETLIKQRLSLIKIIMFTYKPDDEFIKLKKKNEEINKILDGLKYIKNNIILYYKEYYKDIIKKLIDIIEHNKSIKQFEEGKIIELIKDFNNLKEIANKIEKVKSFLLFNVIYEMNSGDDEIKNFNRAYEKLDEIGELFKNNIDVNELINNEKYKEIINKIKEKLSHNEDEAKKLIVNIKEYYNINNETLIDDLTILFTSKKYNLDINSIISFFEYFEKDNEEWNIKLSSEKYKNISNKKFEEQKKLLIDLKKNEIYDYNNIKNYNKIFTCLYDKREAIDFLFTKNIQDIKNLQDKIEITNGATIIKNLEVTIECINHINKMKKLKDNFEIFKYIKDMNEISISQFENYSKIYFSIIELERNNNISNNIYQQINSIIKDGLLFDIYIDSNDIKFYNRDKDKFENITKEELIYLKNQIQIKNENQIFENDKINQQYKLLLFFKNIITNFELINEYMKILLNKGCTLPIKIIFKIHILNIEYYINDRIVDFEDIRNYLSNIKDKYISQLDSIYKENVNLRFLYGKQFRSIMKHLESDFNIDSILRYILNNPEYNINEGNKCIKRITNDYINNYELYNINSFESISMYIVSLFSNNNNKTLENHYNKMKIISKNIYKGIYLYKCDDNTSKQFIINLFWNKIIQLPIAQNLLFTNQETSLEEIQSFFHRAILCNFNTLFVVEINDTFTEYQQSIMNTYIDQLLLIKNIRYNEETKENIENKNINEYLDSCIVFLYNEENIKISSFLKEINKYRIQYFSNDEILEINDTIKNNQLLSKINNIKVITSDICGLGKSEKIRNLIKDNNKKYFHFSLGGRLTKNIIFNKLNILLKELKKENSNEVAIHLDLLETKEKSIMNEFLFSFLITKFYINNENIIYIPKDISIYIEIPNSVENYLDKFCFLKIFNKENISFENMPDFNYSDDIIKIFNQILDINSNEKIKEFIKKYINIENSSYHQINMFINIFISQLNKIKNKMNFSHDKENEMKKIIDISAEGAQYFINGCFAKSLIKINKGIKEINNYKDILSEIYDSDIKNMQFPYPLFFIVNEQIKYFDEYSQHCKNTEEYLEKFKEILELPNEVKNDVGELKSLLSILEEKNNYYVITNDNYKKMLLILYRIKTNVPVIIMGDTGYGKTSLIIKLNKLLNNGRSTIEIININSRITDEKLYEIIKEKNEKAKKLKDKELWIFFDEINTCLSLTLITELFINKTYNGNKICENIRLIGACRPYRKRKLNEAKFGFVLESNNNQLEYLVQPLNESLLYYVLSFGSIDEKDEKNYIYNMIEKLFSKDEKDLHKNTSEILTKCHIYLRQYFDSSIVSLRDISRFIKLVSFLQKYFTKKNEYEQRTNNEKNNKLRGIICSIYLCYYTKLENELLKSNFETTFKSIFLNLINNEITEGYNENLMEQIKNEEFKSEIDSRTDEKINKKFYDFLIIEQDYLINKIELDKGICKNTLLKENLFLLFISLNSNIPLIIIGQPGTSKSLSVQIIINSMKGKYSNNNFFKLFPKLIPTNFQGTDLIQSFDIQNLFNKSKEKLDYYINNNLELPISLVLFEQLDLVEKSKNYPLEELNYNLDNLNKNNNICFIGISNNLLDASITNRSLILYISDLYGKLDELIESSKNIAESFSNKIKNDNIFEILSRTYFEYKNQLKIIKELISLKKYIWKNVDKNENIRNKREKRQFSSIKQEKEFKELLKKEDKININFHGNIDFYNLIKGIAKEFAKLGDYCENEKVSIIVKYIERNFGGIEYEIDIDLDLILDDIRENINLIKKILEDYELYQYDKPIKLNSVFLLKKLYNLECDKRAEFNHLKIDKLQINNYNIKKCIKENIKDENSRFLLLEIKQSLIPFIIEYITLENPFKDIKLIAGSSFISDNNDEYIFDKIKEIQEYAGEDKLIIIENLNQIHPFLFDLYDMNYQKINNDNFVKICIDIFNERLTLINNKFRIIILVDKGHIYKNKLNLINKFEKINLSFEKLLDSKLKNISKNIIDNIGLKNKIERKSDLNYSLKNLLINCEDEEIEGLIYYLNKSIKQKKNNFNDEETDEDNFDEDILKEEVIEKIYKILPQDIICILPENNIIKKKYYLSKNIYNLKNYVDIEEKEKRYKISIIYTFTSVSNIIEGINRRMSCIISDIKSENEFKNIIDEIKIKNEKNKYDKGDYIYIHIEQSDSKKIKFITNYILYNLKSEKYNYIIIIYINRNFNKQNFEKIYSLPDINPDINQIFIDNLNYDYKITLKDILSTNDIKSIFTKFEEIEGQLIINEEFDKTLVNFLKKELIEIGFDYNNSLEYINNIKNYLYEEDSIKKTIIEMTYKYIDDKLEEKNIKDLIDKIYYDNLINKYTVDFASFLIEYIKEEIFDKNLINIFKILEDNNILTTLIENKKREEGIMDINLIKEIIKQYLNEKLSEENNVYKCKFLYNYNIPGLYNFFEFLSNYINKNVSICYYNKEKQLRELLIEDNEKLKEFQELEEHLLNNVFFGILDNNKFIFGIFDKFKNNCLIFKDYITYYLQKYKNNNKEIYNIDDIYHKIIELLVDLRFNNESTRTQKYDNYDKDIDIILMKIIWIESNVNYILNILKIMEYTMIIFDKNENKLINDIEVLINKAIKRNPKITKEINKCYYILLSNICFCITSDEIQLVNELTKNKTKNNEIQIEINKYYYLLKKINIILKHITDDLLISINEMNIIDELIKIIEIYIKYNNIEEIKKIRKNIIEEAIIIQRYSNKESKLIEELIYNYDNTFSILFYNEKINKNDKNYYDNLRYILLKEISRISIINYRYKILEQLLEENEIIKKSNDIFQILLNDFLKMDKYKDNMINILNGNDIIIKLIENKLINNTTLNETIFYLFEKNALIYFNKIYSNKNEALNLKEENFKILKECIDYLKKPSKIENKNKELYKLFCLSYIKIYIYNFIRMFNKDTNNYSRILEVFNGDNNICKIIRNYIYKIFYNNYNIDFIINNDYITKYRLNDYKDFNNLTQIKDWSNLYRIDWEVKTLEEDYYNDTYKVIEKYKKDEFKSNIKDFNIKQCGIDNLYISSYNSTLINLQNAKTYINKNFYEHICQPLFKEDKILIKAIELFYYPKKFNDIKKKYNINSSNIKPLLFGYRYCLNELFYKNTEGIYYPLYNSNNLIYLTEKYYPGNDTKPNIIYYDILNHFKTKPEEGCYVCLSNNWCYHCISSGFQEENELNLICPNCLKSISSNKEGKNKNIVKIDNYYRIFKDDKEIEEIKGDEIKNNKLKKINYMTLKEFQEKYIIKIIKNEKGLYISDKNSFKNTMKIVRFLNPISFRILNYILYIHLFFAGIITEKKDFDKFLPKDMTWIEIINECWNILKIELLKLNIYSIEQFMNYIFPDIFLLLNKEKNIDNFEDLLKLEEKLDSKIQDMIKTFKEIDIKPIKDEDKNNPINLLIEKYNKDYYKEKDYPFYQYFYYTEYLDEKYIYEKLSYLDKSKYPVLRMYLEDKINNKSDKNQHLFKGLNLLNDSLNLFNQKYSNNISKESAKKKILKNEEIYMKNKELIDKFIEWYNNIDIKEIYNKNKLSNNNPLNSFFVDENNIIGKTYKSIYKYYINIQNERIEKLLDIKIMNGKFPYNCKNRVNIEQIRENELFTLNLPTNHSFIDILFNFSYRKLLDNYPNDYRIYKEYIINFDDIEDKMTDLLLKNKKLLNEDIHEFIYNNQIFNNQVTNVITLFKKRYNYKNIILNDKKLIYKFYTENKNNHQIFEKIINDFIQLIKFLNEIDKNNDINEETKISKVIDNLKSTTPNCLIKLFDNNDSLTIDKTTEIFEYFLKIIFNDIKSQIKRYQEQSLNDETEKKINNYCWGVHLINKKDFSNAIRLFISLILYPEEDKENKIKSNNINIINYLRQSDLWGNDIYNNSKFHKNLYELSLFNVKINQIIPLYELLGGDIEDNYFDDVKEKNIKEYNNNSFEKENSEEEEPEEEEENS